MTSFISAGHHLKDPGAIGIDSRQENKETIAFRALVICELHKHGITVINDHDSETLGQYLARIKPGNASVVLEFHFDAASATATGTTALVSDNANKMSLDFAHELVTTTAQTLGIKNRGVWTESQSHRRRLGIMRKDGCVALLEICFITNESDMAKYDLKREELAIKIAQIIAKYDNMIE
ncbi:N-acetylmuramoyl-L-alanine amidase [Olivibacter sp. LS-1]|uniref:N-acetylmuramoyl-L-alanine amidase n=1 Tax=Olivibacter sp. LS-1 TaxID=2592345 RepID=UPI0011EB358C|nr:N-acetylmuramoyl-L-alanine amidase [Olivibacter sp. LS-1]QEL01588.1 N-acetylmuramoyl-L-alanine amidase [Olivibacter sp. LS-1]